VDKHSRSCNPGWWIWGEEVLSLVE
jgi:hypothetical protein